jgi:hypothetical protein
MLFFVGEFDLKPALVTNARAFENAGGAQLTDALPCNSKLFRCTGGADFSGHAGIKPGMATGPPLSVLSLFSFLSILSVLSLFFQIRASSIDRR